MFSNWKADPSSVDSTWQAHFEGVDGSQTKTVSLDDGASQDDIMNIMRLMQLGLKAEAEGKITTKTDPGELLKY